MSSRVDSVRVTMIDALVGNDYSLCLCSALHAIGVDVELVAPTQRPVNVPIDYSIRRWMPTKDSTRGKIGKIFPYLEYLARLFIHMIKNKQRKKVAHIQFLRNEQVECIFFLLLGLLGIRLVITAHNILPHENSKIDRLLRHGIYRAAEKIIVHSEYMKNKLANDFGVDREKVKVIPHGNFDHYISGNPITKAEARSSLNLSEMDSVVLFFGYIREYKGLDLLLDAFEICMRKDKWLKLVIAGAPQSLEIENHYRRRIEQISTDDVIRFHAGFVPAERVAVYFIASDVVALPYREIDHSGIVHLAYSFARPLIATNVGDFSEVIEDGKSGYLLGENSAECLSEIILRAFSNRLRLEAMGNHARILSETRYSWLEIAKKTKEVYETC